MKSPINPSHVTMVALLALAASALAGDLHVIEGGISPDKQFAVAVVPQKPDQPIDEADGSVYLVKYPGEKILQKLEEVDSTGGTWGTTTENVRSKWSPNGHFVAIEIRVGRLMYDFTLYQRRGSKLTQIQLPTESSDQKSEIYKVLTTSANPGCVFMAWQSSTSFTAKEYGLRPANEDIDFSQYGLPDFDGVIEKVYSFKGGKWRLDELRIPK
jgi:hypothetical protein